MLIKLLQKSLKYCLTPAAESSKWLGVITSVVNKIDFRNKLMGTTAAPGVSVVVGWNWLQFYTVLRSQGCPYPNAVANSPYLNPAAQPDLSLFLYSRTVVCAMGMADMWVIVAKQSCVTHGNYFPPAITAKTLLPLASEGEKKKQKQHLEWLSSFNVSVTGISRLWFAVLLSILRGLRIQEL